MQYGDEGGLAANLGHKLLSEEFELFMLHLDVSFLLSKPLIKFCHLEVRNAKTSSLHSQKAKIYVVFKCIKSMFLRLTQFERMKYVSTFGNRE